MGFGVAEFDFASLERFLCIEGRAKIVCVAGSSSDELEKCSLRVLLESPELSGTAASLLKAPVLYPRVDLEYRDELVDPGRHHRVPRFVGFVVREGPSSVTEPSEAGP